MSRDFVHHNENESSENVSDLRKFLNGIRSMKINTKVQFDIVEEDLKTLMKNLDAKHYEDFYVTFAPNTLF